MIDLESIVKTVQKNCDISDALCFDFISDDGWEMRYIGETNCLEYTSLENADLMDYKNKKRKELTKNNFYPIRIGNKTINPKEQKTINSLLSKEFQNIFYAYATNKKNTYFILSHLHEKYNLEGNEVYLLDEHYVHSGNFGRTLGLFNPKHEICVNLPSIRHAIYQYIDFIRLFPHTKKHKNYSMLANHFLKSELTDNEIKNIDFGSLEAAVDVLSKKIGKQNVAYHENGHQKAGYCGNLVREELLADAIKKPNATGTLANIIRLKDSSLLAFYFVNLMSSPNPNRALPEKWMSKVYNNFPDDVNWYEVENMRLNLI